MIKIEVLLPEREIENLEKVMDKVFSSTNKEGFEFTCRDYPSMEKHGGKWINYGDYARLEGLLEKETKYGDLYKIKIELNEEHQNYKNFLLECERKLKPLYNTISKAKAA